MTLLSTFLSFFPALVILLAGASILLIKPVFLGVGLALFFLYGFPVLIYRLHQLIYPVQEGISYLCGKEYSPWWGSHQFQTIYLAIPVLESLLRLIPGAFSVWLRLWGAKIGRNIYWTPGLEIADRGLIEIGDRVVLGHRVGLLSHAIKPRKQNLMLYVKKVKIGNDVFVGAGSYLGPGVIVQDGTYLPVASHIYPNQQVK
jgi:Hexapeptide repeat of succinyl-transferase